MPTTTPTAPGGLLDITLPQPLWRDALDAFSGMRGGRGSMPILDCILLQCHPGDVAPSLLRNDLERQIRVHLPDGTASDGAAGEIAIDAKKFDALIKAYPPHAEVRLRDGGHGRLTLTASIDGRAAGRFSLGTLPGASYPLLSAPGRAGGLVEEPDDSDGRPLTTLRLPGSRLAAALAQTAFAMANNDVRYYLNGLLLEWSGTTLHCAATDGHRLAAISLAATIDGADGQAILPGATVATLQRLATTAGADDVTLDLAHGRCACAVGGIEMISKLIDGKYPDWRRVIPAGHFAIDWQINREDLARALARARILSHEKFHGVALEVTADDPATLRVSATNAEQDQAEETLPLPAPSPPIRAGFNIDYILGVLAACPGDTIAWSLKDGVSGSKLTPAAPAPDDGADNPEWVLMPMNM